MLLLSITSSIIYAIFAAFRTDVDYNGYIEFSNAHNFGLVTMHYIDVEEISFCNKLQVIFESIFLIEMLLGFITEYTNENNVQIKDVTKISMYYLKNGFIFDLIPLIPFNFLLHFRGSRYLFLLKSIRLI